jgi:hypothetical protein
MRTTQSAELSREISRLVVRILAGESIDRDAASAVLADRYSELGMAADLIAKAIDRSVAMLSDIRNGPVVGAGDGRELAHAPQADLVTEAEPAEETLGAEAVDIDGAISAAALQPLPARQLRTGRGARAVGQSLASLRRLAMRLSRQSGVQHSETV